MDVDAAIAGLGITEMGKVYGRTSADFAADAVRRAVDDAGLGLADLDGLLVSAGVGGGLGIDLAARLGLYDLPLLSSVNSFGSTAAGDGAARVVRHRGRARDDGRVRVRRRTAHAVGAHR